MATEPGPIPSDRESPLLLPEQRTPVPWRTILATVGVVVVTYFLLLFVRNESRVLIRIVVAGFFAVVLSPAVDALDRRVHRRALSTSLVFLTCFGVLALLIYVFVTPIVDQADNLVESLPELVDDAQAGRGPVGELVDRYDLDRWVNDNQERLQGYVSDLSTPALNAARSVFNGLIAFLTVSVLAFLMVLRGPQICASALVLIPRRHRERVGLMSVEASRAVSGYVAGNLVISIVAGLATYALLLVLGVPYASVIALWVAFADIIPLVGATLGAIPTVGLAFLHSPAAGVAALIFYIVYQQFENHVLQPAVMSRTVAVSPLMVIVSVLIGVELLGFLGALLAIPAAGVLSVVVRTLLHERQVRAPRVVEGAPADSPD